MARKLTELTAVTTAGDGTLFYLVDPNLAAGSRSVGMTKENVTALIGTSNLSDNPVENTYVDNAAMFADQGNQTTGFFQYVSGADNYYEKLATSTGTIDDYNLLSDTQVQVLRGNAAYNVFRVSDVQDDATPLTSVQGGRIGIEYDNGTDAVTGILLSAIDTDAFQQLVDVGSGSIVLYNQSDQTYYTTTISGYTTVNTDYTRIGLDAGINRTNFSVNDRVRLIIDLGAGGSSIPASDTGTTITFTEDTLYNEATYLTSGNLTLDLTGAVKGVISQVYCDSYVPTISGEEYLLSSGALDASELNILSFFYDGTQILLNISNVIVLTAPTLTAVFGDTEADLSWTSVGGADNYVLERSTDNFATAGTEVYSGALLTFNDIGLTNGTTYYYRVKAEGAGNKTSDYSTVQSGTPAVPSTDFTINLSDSWQFESNLNGYNGNNGTAVSFTPVYPAGKVGNALTFVGASGDYLSIGNGSGAWNMGSGGTEHSFSVALWVKLDVLGTGQRFVDYGRTSTTRQWFVLISPSDDLIISVRDSTNANNITQTISSGFSTGTWYHVCWTYDGSTSNTGLNTYINGVQQSGGRGGIGTFTGMGDHLQDLIIGANAELLTTNNFNGDMDEIKIYKDRELSSSEVLEMYNDENAGTSVLP